MGNLFTLQNKTNCANKSTRGLNILSPEVLGKSDKFCRMRCKKGVQNSLPGSLFFSLPFSPLSSPIGAPCIFFYRLLYFLLRARSGPILLSVDIRLFFFYISFSFFWFLRILLVVLFGRAKECAALGLITPSEGTGGRESSAYATVCGRIFGILDRAKRAAVSRRSLIAPGLLTFQTGDGGIADRYRRFIDER